MSKVRMFMIGTAGFLAFNCSFLERGLAQVAVSVTPSEADVRINQTQQFIATVSGTPDQRVTWSIISGGSRNYGPGSVNSSGLYTAPDTAPPPPFVTIEARSVADPTASGTALIIVRDVRNYTETNADDDLAASAYDGGATIGFRWIGLPDGTTRIVISAAPTRDGPWTEVLVDEFPDDLTRSGSVEYINKQPIPPDPTKDYFYKLEAFSATGLLLKSYAPVFVPKFAPRASGDK